MAKSDYLPRHIREWWLKKVESEKSMTIETIVDLLEHARLSLPNLPNGWDDRPIRNCQGTLMGQVATYNPEFFETDKFGIAANYRFDVREVQSAKGRIASIVDMRRKAAMQDVRDFAAKQWPNFQCPE